MVVNFSVGDDCVPVGVVKDAEGLLSGGRQIVDGESVKANDAGIIQMNDGMVWPPRFDLVKASQFLRSEFNPVNNCPNTTHLYPFLNLISKIDAMFELIPNLQNMGINASYLIQKT